MLVEPDGTTGSYILYDKTTLAQLAVVNQAGQQIDINQNGISITNTPLSAEVQKLINDVFTLKFTDLWNQHPTTSTAQNDTITPQSQGLGCSNWPMARALSQPTTPSAAPTNRSR